MEMLRNIQLKSNRRDTDHTFRNDKFTRELTCERFSWRAGLPP